MITGKFHSHITIRPEDAGRADEAAKAVMGKVTFVDLNRRGGDGGGGGDVTSPAQTDYMITHHYVTGYKGLTGAGDVLSRLREHADRLEQAGVAVLRIKLEHEWDDARTPDGCKQESCDAAKYIEAHIKVGRAAQIPASMGGWALSENARTGSRFLTRRWAGGTAYEMVKDDGAIGLAGVGPLVEELKLEAVLYDDNPAMDEWWAGRTEQAGGTNG